MDAEEHAGSRHRAQDENAVAIEPVLPEEAESVSTLAAEIWRRHYADIISTAQIEYMLKQRYDPPIIRAELERHDLWWDKLLVTGEIVGFSSYFLTGEPGEMKLDKLYVRQKHQRKGYGGRLLARVCRQARALGCSRLVLTVNRNNRTAISAYLKYGFAVSATQVKDIGGGFVMDDYVMVRSL
jgi:GNAT superfamily N-acetyltransferase